MNTKHEDFYTVQLLAMGERSVSVARFNGDMAVCAEEGPVLISKEQAMEFFNITEKKDSTPINTETEIKNAVTKLAEETSNTARQEITVEEILVLISEEDVMSYLSGWLMAKDLYSLVNKDLDKDAVLKLFNIKS